MVRYVGSSTSSPFIIKSVQGTQLFTVNTPKQGTILSSYGFTDSIGVPTDNLNFQIQKYLFDTITVFDSINVSGTLNQIIADSSTVIDLVGVNDGITYGLHKYFYDEILVLDSFGYLLAQGFSPTPDSIGVSEASILGFGKNLSDSLTTSELTSFSVSLVKSDLAEIIELATLSIGKTFSDSSSSTDLVSLGPEKNFADSSSIIDNINAVFGKNLSEILTSTESSVLSVSLVKSDSALISELVSLNPGKVFADSTGASIDTINNFVFGKSVSDNATAVDLVLIPDGLTYSISKSVADILNATEVFQREVTYSRAFFDSSTASESVSLLAQFDRIFTDSSTITDTTVYNVGKLLSDSSTASESASLVAEFNRLFADSSSATESETYVLVKPFFDSSTASESVSLLAQFDRIFTDSSTATETVVVSQGWIRSFSDSVSAFDSQDFVAGKGLRFDSDFVLAIDSDGVLVSQGWGRPSADSTSATEVISLVAEFNRLFADSSTAIESTVFTVGLTLQDSATILDLVGVPDLSTYSLNKELSDSIGTPIDTNTLAFGKFLNDSSVITETSVYTFGLFKNNEILSPIDIPVFTVGLSLTDSSSINQVISLQTSLVKTDSSTITESGLISVQNYFAEEYVSFSERYVETSNTVF